MTLGLFPPWLNGILAAAQVSALVWLVLRRRAPRYRALLLLGVLTIGVAALVLADLPAGAVGMTITGCCHAIAYGLLLTWFARSLRPGREPVVTGLARRVRRSMPDKVARYTRQVTIAWCVFFGVQLGLSAVLLVAAPDVWNAFVALLNLPLLAAMTIAEFTCRRVIFRNEPRSSLIETLSTMRHIRGTPAGRP